MQRDSYALAGRLSGIGLETHNGAAATRGNTFFSPALVHILREVRHELSLTSDNDFESNFHKDSSKDSAQLINLVTRVAGRLGLSLTGFERDQIIASIERENRPFGLLQELADDPQVSDIIITNYAKIAVQQGRRNFQTALAFSDQETYENFVERLLQRAGASYSTKRPIADGMIGSFARIHVMHKCLCESGPYLTIRLNRFSTINVAQLAKYELAPLEILSYLEALVRTGRTILVVGEVGTGKTTIVRALAASIPQHESILVIEDTAEIRLEHPHVRYVNTREVNTEGEGRVSPSECIRAGMRMAMNRIIFGEIRDAEAAESFIDVCASGHPGLSTIHARSALEAVTRLELFLGRAQGNVSRQVLMDQVVTAVQIICVVDVCRQTGRRRIVEVREIGPVADGVLRQREIFAYAPERGRAAWKVVNKISAHRAVLEPEIPGPSLCLGSLPNILFAQMQSSAVSE